MHVVSDKDKFFCHWDLASFSSSDLYTLKSGPPRWSPLIGSPSQASSAFPNSTQVPVGKCCKSVHSPNSLKWPARTATEQEASYLRAVYGPKTFEEGGASLHPKEKQNGLSNQKSQSMCLECFDPRHHEVSISSKGPCAPSMHTHTRTR